MRAGTVVVSFSLSLLAAGALADKAVEAYRPPRTRLRLVWTDIHASARDARAVVFAEAARLLRPVGVDVEWEVSDGGQRDVRRGEVQVVVLRTPPPTMSSRVMGAAQPGARGVRVVWVYVSTVRAALGLDPMATERLRPMDAQRLGRGLARVVLHEVVHVLDPERPHDGSGLMAALLSRATLESGSLEPELGALVRAASAAAPEHERGAAATVAVMAPMVMD